SGEGEAKAMGGGDGGKGKGAGAETANVRAQIQEEIEATKKQRSRTLREQEKARQFDRQREEIHPSSVLATLKTLAPPDRESFRLPKATPDEARASNAQLLPIRYREKEVDR